MRGGRREPGLHVMHDRERRGLTAEGWQNHERQNHWEEEDMKGSDGVVE